MSVFSQGLAPGRASWLWAVRLLVLALCAVPSAVPAGAAIVDTDFWGPTGPVFGMVQHGDTLYVGGNFGALAPLTGSFVALDTTTASVRPGWPRVKGVVRACLPDGAGGVYLGGSFVSVGGVPRAGLAHLLADGSLADWNPGADGPVYALAWLDSNTVLAGGAFLTLAGRSGRGLGAVDAQTGAPAPWGPTTLGDGEVRTLAISGPAVYVGGWFSSIAGTSRRYVAALSAASGAVLPWNPDPNYAVLAIAPHRGLVYLGGAFTTMRGDPRSGLAVVDSVTGVATDAAPATPVIAQAFALTPTTLWVGHQNGTGSVNLATGAMALGTGGPSTEALLVSGSYLYMAGAGGVSRQRVAGNGGATPWTPLVRGTVHALGVAGDAVCAGGGFSAVGGVSSGPLAAIDLRTGRPTSWQPQVSYVATPMADGGAALYVGGNFQYVAGQRRYGVAALDWITGAPTPWAPVVPDRFGFPTVHAMAANAGVGYLCYGGTATNRVDLTTGAFLGWPEAPGTFSRMTFDGTTAWVMGGFTSIGGRGRTGIAAIDLRTHLASPWNAQLDGGVGAAVFTGSTVYVGGMFRHAGSLVRNYLAALDTSTALPTAWAPEPNDRVTALAVGPGAVYAGGAFSAIGGAARSGVAALDAVTGQAIAWDPGLRMTTSDLLLRGSTLYVANSQDWDGNTVQGIVPVAVTAVASPPTVHVQLPAAGDTLAVGTSRDLAWIATAPTPGVHWIDLQLSRTGRSGPWESLARAISNSGHHAWTVTGPASADCRLRVIAYDHAGTSAADTSAAPFVIAVAPASTQIASFAATLVANGVQVGWRLTGPQTADLADVERRADGDTGPWAIVAGARACTPDSCVLLDVSTATGLWWYRVSITDTHGTRLSSAAALVDRPAPPVLPTAFAIAPPSPHPNDGSGSVAYAVPRRAAVRLSLLDLQGRELAVLADGVHEPGRYTVPLGSRVRRSGLYLLRLHGDGVDVTRRLVIVR